VHEDTTTYQPLTEPPRESGVISIDVRIGSDGGLADDPVLLNGVLKATFAGSGRQGGDRPQPGTTAPAQPTAHPSDHRDPPTRSSTTTTHIEINL
jgi:hypothetical protein